MERTEWKGKGGMGEEKEKRKGGVWT